MKNTKKIKIGILGFGNMGSAIFKLLHNENKLKKKFSFLIYSLGLTKVKGAYCVESVEGLFNMSDIVFLCVKPQDFYSLPIIDLKQTKKLIIISIMAGVPVACIKKIIHNGFIIRTMPNLPLQIGEGMIGWYKEKDNKFTNDDILTIKKIFSSFGKSIEVTDENLIDAITAVSGSGPAYVFLFIDALIKAAQNLGFDKQAAEKMVLQTVSGSLAYLKQQDELDLERLIEKVRSKKGTTDAALKELNITRFNSKWQMAIKKAYLRARELSKYDKTRT